MSNITSATSHPQIQAANVALDALDELGSPHFNTDLIKMIGAFKSLITTSNYLIAPEKIDFLTLHAIEATTREMKVCLATTIKKMQSIQQKLDQGFPTPVADQNFAHILEFLCNDPATMRKMVQTSKTLKTITEEEIKRFLIHGGALNLYYKDPQKAVSFIIQSGQKSVHFDASFKSPISVGTEAMSRTFQSLTQLKMPGTEIREINFSLFDHLQSLNIGRVQTSDLESLALHTSALTKLKFRVANRGDSLAQVAMLSNLVTLQIGCPRDSGEEEFRKLSVLNGLRALSFVNCPCLDATGLGHLTTLAGLTKLELIQSDLTLNQMEIIKTFTGLKKLNLSESDFCDNDIVPQIAALTTLTALDLSRSRTLRENSVPYFGQLTSLQSLNLSGCPGISDTDLMSLFGLAQLRKLDIRGLWNISEATLFAWQTLNKNLVIYHELPDKLNAKGY